MSTPNFIPGMRMRGIGRRPKQPYLSKRDKSWLKFQSFCKKQQLEFKRKELANRPFEE